MIENFDKAFEFVVAHEGYKSDDQADPGGRTIFGISARSFPDQVAEMWNLPQNEAKAIARGIYRLQFWNALDLDTYAGDRNQDVVIFDTAVNLGVDKTRALLGASRRGDGNIDILQFLTFRVLHYTNLVGRRPLMGRFLKGWISRVVDCWRLVKP